MLVTGWHTRFVGTSLPTLPEAASPLTASRGALLLTAGLLRELMCAESPKGLQMLRNTHLGLLPGPEQVNLRLARWGSVGPYCS